jgi:hypothetical protein
MATEAGTLLFWKPAGGKRKAPAPGKVYKALLSGDQPDYAEDLPVEQIVLALAEQYPGLERTGKAFAEVDLDAEQAGIEMAWNRKHFCLDFYGDAVRQMEAATALMSQFGCSCYWVDDGQLYPPDTPPKFYDAEFDEHMDKVFDVLGKHAMSGGEQDPQARLKRMLDFMKSGELEKQVGKPPAAKQPSKPQGRRKTKPRKRRQS